MENKEIDKLFISFSDEMRKWAADADWFDSAHSSGLSELCRFGQKTIGDFIESAREKNCKNIEQLQELLKFHLYHLFNLYKAFQSDHFDHLSELFRFGYLALGDIESIICSN